MRYDVDIFSKRFIELFSNSPYRQADIARITGASRTAVNQWLSGTVPKIDYIIEICNFFNMDINSFFTNDIVFRCPQIDVCNRDIMTAVNLLDDDELLLLSDFIKILLRKRRYEKV